MNNSKKEVSSPIVTAFLFLVFTIPFSLGSLNYMLIYSVALLLLFPLYGFVKTKSVAQSPSRFLKDSHPAILVLLLLFLLSSAISTILVFFAETSLQHKAMAGIRYVEYVLLSLYCFALARLYLAKYVTVTQVFMMIVYGSLVSIVLFAYIYFIDDAPNVRYWPTDPPIGTNLRMTGIILSVAIITCVVRLYVEKNSTKMRLFLYFSLFALSAFLVWTASRINVLAVILSMLILAVLMRKWLHIGWKQLLAVFFVFFMAFPVGEYFAIEPWGGVSRMIGSVADRMDEEDALNAIGSNRIEVWKAAIKAGAEKPVFGQGPYGYYFSGYAPEGIEREHNLFLHFFVEFGLLGAFFISTFLFLLAFYGAKYAKQAFLTRDINWLIAASVILVLTLSSVANRVYEFVLSIFLLCSAFAVFPFYRQGQVSEGG